MENLNKVPSEKKSISELDIDIGLEKSIQKALNKKETKDNKTLDNKRGVVVENIKDKEYTLEVIKDYDGVIDPFYLSKKDPNYAYRFLRFEPKNMNIKTSNMLFQKGGWQPCPKEHCLRIGIKEAELGPDGLCHRGDQILAFMPKKLFEEKEEFKRRQANEPMDAIQRLIKHGDPDNPELKGLGHETMKGLQTQKALGM